jgi:hypothetical protein
VLEKEVERVEYGQCKVESQPTGCLQGYIRATNTIIHIRIPWETYQASIFQEPKKPFQLCFNNAAAMIFSATPNPKA